MSASTYLQKLYATIRAMRPSDVRIIALGNHPARLADYQARVDTRQPFTVFNWIDRLARVGKTTQSVCDRLTPTSDPIFTFASWEQNLATIGRPLSKELKKHPTDDDPDPATRKTGERKHGFAFIQWQENRPMLPPFHKS